jgi:hypothetical protein
MESQYCKVGSVSPMNSDTKEIGLLEYQYQHFMDKAMNNKYTDSKLAEFFELKAMKIKKIIQSLTQ